jgi:hypothetical protein
MKAPMSKPKSASAMRLCLLLLLPLIAAGQDARFIGKTTLPDQVPYLNRREHFFVGGGIAGGGGDGDGRWNFLVGPDYSCPNYLSNEEIRLLVDSKLQLMPVNMHRARNTGVFYGLASTGDLKFCLVDYAAHGEPWTVRLVMIKNDSAANDHIVSVQAWVWPMMGKGRSAAMARDAAGRASGISLKLDTSLRCVANRFCQNWANRSALIAFNDPSAVATNIGDALVLDAGAKHIAAGGSVSVALYHHMHYDDQTDGDCIRLIRKRNALDDAENCIRQWQDWLSGVATGYSLDLIKDQRARDIVEGGLVVLKMNQARDGGIVASERSWDMTYVRDAYCALRGLGECGHFDELRSFIQWLDHQYSVHGFIPNAAPAGSDTYVHHNGNSGGGPCPEANAAVEVTALYLLAARDYFNSTHDLATLTNADKSLRYAIDVQLKQAVANGYRLEFGGDETELAAGDVGATGLQGALSRQWSMTSVALCAASLDFYIRYLKEKGANPAAYLTSLDNRRLNLNEELDRLKDALEADFWRTNLPECPGGFHDSFRSKSDGAWPRARIVNFTLFPLYYGTPLKYPDRAGRDVAAMKQFFNPTTGLLPLMGVANGKSCGHDLGYLLWCLVAVGDPEKAAVYDALVNGRTVGCWGSYNESYDGDGVPNANNGLRSFETGVNIGALARYWGLGGCKPGRPLAVTAFPPETWVPVNDNHSAITYSGDWSYSTTCAGYYQSDCHFSSYDGNSVQFTFQGTGIRWIGGKNDDHGYAQIYVDDKLQSSVSTYASSWLAQQLLYEKTGLPDGRHTIRIVVIGGGVQDVDAFQYRTGKSAP